MTTRLYPRRQAELDALALYGEKWITLEHDPKQVEQQVQNSIVWDSWINTAEYKSIDKDSAKNNITDMVLHSELQGRKHGKHSMARAARAQAKARKRRR